jgi:hypothetical protein
VPWPWPRTPRDSRTAGGSSRAFWSHSWLGTSFTSAKKGKKKKDSSPQSESSSFAQTKKYLDAQSLKESLKKKSNKKEYRLINNNACQKWI